MSISVDMFMYKFYPKVISAEHSSILFPFLCRNKTKKETGKQNPNPKCNSR